MNSTDKMEPSTTTQEQPGDPRFLAAVEDMRQLHIKKTQDYGNSTNKDPLANLRASERFGVPAWVGAMLRLNDKVTRVQSFIANGRLANEPIEDSFRDIAAYALLALILFQETNKPPLTSENIKQLVTKAMRGLGADDAQRMFPGAQR